MALSQENLHAKLGNKVLTERSEQVNAFVLMKSLSLSSCPRDPSVRFHASSDPTKVRFSFEAFQFLGDHDYVFVHCRVHVCDVNDANSRCAKGCLSGGNPVVQDHAKHSSKAEQSDKPAKSVAQPKEKHIKKVVAPASDKTRKLHAAAKKLAGKPAVQPDAKRAKASLPSEKKVQDHAKAPEKKSEKTAHRIMKRAAARSHKRGVLGSADLSSKGPFILDVKTKREPRPKKVFPHAKRSGINTDVKEKNKRKFLLILLFLLPRPTSQID